MNPHPPGSPSAEWSLLSVEQVLEHALCRLDAADIACLRLAAKCFRHYPAVLRSCFTAVAPSSSMQHFQAGLQFLQRLPRLHGLRLQQCRSLYGVQQLSQLWTLQVSALTNLQQLEIRDDDCDIAPNAPDHTALSRLTCLMDNALCIEFVHTLPHSYCLDVNTVPNSLGSLPLTVTLRALGIYLGDVPVISPLSTLTRLERLELNGLPLPIPALSALTSLTLYFSHEDVHSSFPTILSSLGLCELHLSLCTGLKLPSLAQYERLEIIYCVDHGAGLYLNARHEQTFGIEFVDSLRPLDLFLEVEDS